MREGILAETWLQGCAHSTAGWWLLLPQRKTLWMKDADAFYIFCTVHKVLLCFVI